jgi:hypothetical protein
MKALKVDSGVFRLEPEESDAPVWDLSPQQVLHRGWSEELVSLIARYLRSGDQKTDEMLGSESNLRK